MLSKFLASDIISRILNLWNESSNNNVYVKGKLQRFDGDQSTNLKNLNKVTCSTFFKSTEVGFYE